MKEYKNVKMSVNVFIIVFVSDKNEWQFWWVGCDAEDRRSWCEWGWVCIWQLFLFGRYLLTVSLMVRRWSWNCCWWLWSCWIESNDRASEACMWVIWGYEIEFVFVEWNREAIEAKSEIWQVEGM